MQGDKKRLQKAQAILMSLIKYIDVSHAREKG